MEALSKELAFRVESSLETLPPPYQVPPEKARSTQIGLAQEMSFRSSIIEVPGQGGAAKWFSKRKQKPAQERCYTARKQIKMARPSCAIIGLPILRTLRI